MLAYERLTVEFYSAPRLKGGGKPFVTTPDQSVIQTFEAEDDFMAKRPQDAYAFRLVPVMSEIQNQGLRGEERYHAIVSRDMPLMFLGGTHLDAEKIKFLFGTRSAKAKALKNYAQEFVLTPDDVLVTFDASRDDMVLRWDGEGWAPEYPAMTPDEPLPP